MITTFERGIITSARNILTSLKRQRRKLPSLALQACEDISNRSNIAGRRETVLQLLEARFGQLSATVRQRVEALSADELRQLTDDSGHFHRKIYARSRWICSRPSR